MFLWKIGGVTGIHIASKPAILKFIGVLYNCSDLFCVPSNKPSVEMADGHSPDRLQMQVNGAELPGEDEIRLD